MNNPELINYARQAEKPEWAGKIESHAYESAESGSSRNNEWYEFESEQAGIEWFSTNGSSQSLVDQVNFITVNNVTYAFFTDDLAELGAFKDDAPDFEEWCESNESKLMEIMNRKGTAALGDLVNYESAF